MSRKDDYTHVIDHLLDKKKLYDTIEHAHSYDINIQSGLTEIFLMGREEYVLPDNEEQEPGIEWTIANRFIRNINLAMRHPGDKPVLIHMKTCGGYWTEGMAIYNSIKACHKPVTILNYTHARSMSSIIFQAAEKRVMMPDSTFMFHFGEETSPNIQMGQAEHNYEIVKQTYQRMLDIYTDKMKEKGKYSKRSRKFIQDWLKEQMEKKVDVHLTAQEAVELGLADEVFGANGVFDWSGLVDYEEE